MSTEVFVIGTGRCGSTLLSRALATHPSLLSLSEYFTVLGGGAALRQGPLAGATLFEQLMTRSADLSAFMRHRADVPELIGSPSASASPLLAAPLYGLVEDPAALLTELGVYLRGIPVDDAATQHGRVFSWLARRLRKEAWVERSGGSAEYVSELVRGWPSAKLVHIARRGPECVASMSRHPFFRVKLARILERDDRLPVDACLKRALPLERFAALWSADMLRTDRVLSHVPPERRMTLRYEDLLHRPALALRELMDFVLPGDRHEAWASTAAQLVARAPTPPLPVAMATAYRPGMRIYERMRGFA